MAKTHPEVPCTQEMANLLGTTVKDIRHLYRQQRDITPLIKSLESTLKQKGYHFGEYSFALEVVQPSFEVNSAYSLLHIDDTPPLSNHFRVALPNILDSAGSQISPAWLVPVGERPTQEDALRFGLAFDIR